MSRGQPLPSAREDGVSQGHNSTARGVNKCSRTGAGGTSSKCMADGAGLKLASGKRAKRARIKRGMRGSGRRAERHRLRTFNLTNQGTGNETQNMSAKEVKSILGRRKSKNDNLSPREEEDLLDKYAKDVEQQMAIKAEKAAVEERRTVMSMKVPTRRDWTPDLKEDDDLTFLGVNINSLVFDDEEHA